MGKTISIIFCLAVLFACKKDKVPVPCSGVSMTGERQLFVGTWHWYSTTVEEWFDIGPSIYHDYTPQNQNFEYYFDISQDGIFTAYENGSIKQQFVLGGVDFENLDASIVNVITFNKDCSESLLDIRQSAFNLTDDTIYLLEYPLNFDDQVNHLRTGRNYFVRE